MWAAVRAPDRTERVEKWASRHGLAVGGVRVLQLAVRTWSRAVEVRVTGLAAEMTYYALISLIPLITAVGAALGFAERVLGDDRVRRIEEFVLDGLGTVFEARVTDEALRPLVQGLLREERTGVAVGGVLVALWLASRMFRAAIRALDDAYGVPERRSLLEQWALGLGLAVAAVVTVVVVLVMLVVGPLVLGGDDGVVAWLGGEAAWREAWVVARWPVVVVVCVAFLVVLYRFAPNARLAVRACLPGAVLGTLALVGIAVGLQAYLATVGTAAPDVGRPGEAVAVAAQVIGVVLAGVLWAWLSSIAILGGGVVNAEIARLRGTWIAPARGRAGLRGPARAGARGPGARARGPRRS